MALVRTDVSEERIASITRVGKNQRARNNVSSNLVTQRRGTSYVVPTSVILYTPTKRRFLQEPHVVVSQKTALFIIMPSS
jgi:hypothetical protein